MPLRCGARFKAEVEFGGIPRNTIQMARAQGLSMDPHDLLGSFDYVDAPEGLLRLIFAIVAGFALGLDREVRDRRVGVRTYMLVSLGAAAFALLTMELSTQMRAVDVGADPTRIAQGLIGAIGFLGAGAIIQGQGKVGGLATAASLWVSGAVGMACGLGYLFYALGVAILAAAILSVSKWMEGRGNADRPDIDEVGSS